MNTPTERDALGTAAASFYNEQTDNFDSIGEQVVDAFKKGAEWQSKQTLSIDEDELDDSEQVTLSFWKLCTLISEFALIYEKTPKQRRDLSNDVAEYLSDRLKAALTNKK